LAYAPKEFFEEVSKANLQTYQIVMVQVYWHIEYHINDRNTRDM
jgi:hypothetical protein